THRQGSRAEAAVRATYTPQMARPASLPTPWVVTISRTENWSCCPLSQGQCCLIVEAPIRVASDGTRNRATLRSGLTPIENDRKIPWPPMQGEVNASEHWLVVVQSGAKALHQCSFISRCSSVH